MALHAAFDSELLPHSSFSFISGWKCQNSAWWIDWPNSFQRSDGGPIELLACLDFLWSSFPVITGTSECCKWLPLQHQLESDCYVPSCLLDFQWTHCRTASFHVLSQDKNMKINSNNVQATCWEKQQQFGSNDNQPTVCNNGLHQMFNIDYLVHLLSDKQENLDS